MGENDPNAIMDDFHAIQLIRVLNSGKCFSVRFECRVSLKVDLCASCAFSLDCAGEFGHVQLGLTSVQGQKECSSEGLLGKIFLEPGST